MSHEPCRRIYLCRSCCASKGAGSSRKRVPCSGKRAHFTKREGKGCRVAAQGKLRGAVCRGGCLKDFMCLHICKEKRQKNTVAAQGKLRGAVFRSGCSERKGKERVT
eukprot:1140479-Pelagomonas_calceolata.AAC.2